MADKTPDTQGDKPLFRRLWVLCLIVFIDMVGFGVIIPSQPFWTKSFGATAFEIALVMSVYSACQFVFAFPLGWLSDRVGRKPVLLFSLLGSVVSFTLVGLADTLLMIVLARALGGAMSANIAVAYAYVADVTGGEERARAMGLLGASIGAGFVLGPFIGGVVAGPGPANPGQLAVFVGAALS
ncbi:MAG: MFS transporter, partial [Rhodospirillaceae bacterium]|nr:MFS transporter [Rhodospirillaceae bacterium]